MPSCSARSSRSSLRATSLSRRRSWAAKTSPMPPWPRRSPSRYRPPTVSIWFVEDIQHNFPSGEPPYTSSRCPRALRGARKASTGGRPRPVWWGSRRPPNDEGRWHHQMPGLAAVFVTSLEQQPHGRHPHLAARLVDRREVDVPQPRERDVVVADQGHVSGNPQSVVVQRVERADRGEVVPHEDPGHQVPFTEHRG